MYMISTYTKIMIVRHPLERLLSAYNNKFCSNTTDGNAFQKNYARQMIAFARQIPLYEVPEDGKGMTFNEFLYFLSHQKTIHMQEHWRPMHQICFPCLIQYDYIGKFETIEKDSNEILSRLGSSIKFPSQKRSKTPSKLKILQDSLPDSVSELLYKNYLPDYKLFDYDKSYL